jgi:hypothetical protein
MVNSDERAAAGDGQQWWFCTRHMRVEPADTPCPGKDLLGPYQTKEEAAHALDKVKERNEAWDAQDN